VLITQKQEQKKQCDDETWRRKRGVWCGVLTFCRAVDGLTYNRTIHDRSTRFIPHSLFFRPINPLALVLWVLSPSPSAIRGILKRDTKHVPSPSQSLDKAKFQTDILTPHLRAVCVEPQPPLQQHARGTHPAVCEFMRRGENIQCRRAGVQLYGSRGDSSRECARAGALSHA
jgi:hypothetical protein